MKQKQRSNNLGKRLKKFGFVLAILLIVVSITLYASTIWRRDTNNYDTSIEELKSLPYLSWTDEEVDETVSGVIFHDSKKAFEGYNLYFDEVDKALLMDMSGKIVHTWNLPIKGQWEYGIILKNGDLVAVAVGKEVAKVDWNSNIIWERKISVNHDVEGLSDNSYLVPYNYFRKYNSYNVRFDSIAHISMSGYILDEWSTFENFDEIKKLHKPSALDKRKKSSNKQYDYYHLNTIKILPDTPLGKKDKRFQKGNWLICLRNTNLILILDKDTKEIVWHWGPGNLDWPHMPVMLENGDILIFDNGAHRDYSRVIQINPLNKNITWEYKANPPEKFYTKFRGSAQRFENGNTLITESAKGRVFEITKKGEVVWDFYNPEIKDGHRKRIYRMIKYPKEKIDPLLSTN